ncbi:glycoside hydrolase family 47 protein [Mycena maculata]|uniref:alpha-1,2-Mannosidase n=1 Tax=Mycena maculata TaxID=230809 RepID=A0AAD7JFF1_9AGAR|nr:glycoside hydrolase family 47 protein [Mycena maculata]
MAQRFTSPYLRLQQHPQVLQILRSKPVLYAAIFLVALFVFFREAHQREYLSFKVDKHALPTNTPLHVWDERAAEVKRAFMHAYRGYEQYAAPHDELRPVSSGFADPFNGWGVTAADSLDTMLLMKLDEEYGRALAQMSKLSFTLPEDKFAPFFETVIRYLGGFLSGYAMTKDAVLLTLAEDLAVKLDPVFDKYSGKFPVYGVNTQTGETIGPEVGILAEMATLQLEYLYLAKATGKKRYFDRANTVMTALATADLHKTGGMIPVRWNLTSVTPFDSYLSTGAQADSTHEYLLKQYLLTAKTDKKSLEMYIRATTHIIANLLYVSPTRRLLYVTDTSSATFEHAGRPTHAMEHLSCFLPGLLALGAHTLPLDDPAALGLDLNALGAGLGWAAHGYAALGQQRSLRDIHLWAAAGLAETCYMLYADQPTGLGPEQVLFKLGDSNRWGLAKDGRWLEGGGRRWIGEVEAWQAAGAGSGTWKGRRLPPGVGEDTKPVVYTELERMHGSGKGRDYGVKQTGYLLRPETVESLYIMWRVTGETKWREMGWRIFEAIERETRTPAGYATLKTVEVVPGIKDDSMPSYFLAETLKYLYLMFINEDPFPLDAWVFNTEAHPLPVFEWTQVEKERFGID